MVILSVTFCSQFLIYGDNCKKSFEQKAIIENYSYLCKALDRAHCGFNA